jgi:hypothetical protein
MKIILVRSAYMGCPCHEGTGLPDIVVYHSLRAAVEDINTNFRDYEYATGRSLEEVKDQPICSFDFKISTGNHCVTECEIRIYDRTRTERAVFQCCGTKWLRMNGTELSDEVFENVCLELFEAITAEEDIWASTQATIKALVGLCK